MGDPLLIGISRGLATSKRKIENVLAERVGLDFRHLAQVAVKTRHIDHVSYLCGFQMQLDLPAQSQ